MFLPFPLLNFTWYHKANELTSKLILPQMSPSPNADLPTFNPYSSMNLMKLTHTNYPTWKATILPYLKGQKVFGYIHGTHQQLAKTISTFDGSYLLMISRKPKIILSLAALIIPFWRR